MTEKELSYNIFNFLKLNAKKVSFPKIYKYNEKCFFLIQEIYKNINNLNPMTYDNIFYNFKTTLSGEEWLKIFLNSENIIEYHNNIRINYPKINQKKFKEKVYFDVFNWFFNSKKILLLKIVKWI